MRFWQLLSVLSLLCILSVARGDRATQKAEFALVELQKLSETGIYSTLSIRKATIEGEHEGIFHHNTILSLDLHSPHFASKLETENYRMVLMTHKHTNITTLAIDQFPVMDDDAIEKFYIDMVKSKRKLYRREMESLELEADRLQS